MDLQARSNPVHRNIVRHRALRGLSLSGLAERSGIAKSTLSQLEAGEGNPTIETLWAIASALGVSFGQLADTEVVSTDTQSTGIAVRFIEKAAGDPEVEVYSLDVPPNCRKDSASHPTGVRERVTVLSGAAYVGQVERPRLLHSGDSYLFEADVPHFYAATEQGARMHVVIEYPSTLYVSSARTSYLGWPTTESQWDGVQAAIDRMLTEVSNGLDVRILRFQRAPTNGAEVQLRAKTASIRTRNFRWPLFCSVELDEHGPYFTVIGLHWARSSNTDNARLAGSRKEVSDHILYLAWLAQSPSIELNAAQTTQVAEFLSSSSWTISTLAAEVLLQRGQIAMPSQLKHLSSRELSSHSIADDGAFSSRINVEHYDAFELLHPAYARQVVVVAEDIYTFLQPTDITAVVDVGTGPGVPLLMLREMLPGRSFVAIEPDDVAIGCLMANLQGVSDVTAVQKDFLSYESTASSVPLITSIGASHHFNTAFMMQKAMQLLCPAGLLVVADEFLPPFSRQDERNVALVLHHSAYLLHTMQWLGDGTANDTDIERTIYKEFRRSMTQAWISAREGNGVRAVSICRELYMKMRHEGLSKTPDGDIGSFVRFFWLELQAMVAGFDYEVEQKSHPLRFAELAAFAGFELVSHRRIFATIGESDWAGGTHVFAFRKPAFLP